MPCRATRGGARVSQEEEEERAERGPEPLLGFSGDEQARKGRYAVLA